MEFKNFVKSFFRICILFGLLNSSVWAVGYYYIPCDINIQYAKTETQKDILKSFNKVKDKLQTLEQAYKEKLSELSNSNKLLRKQVAIKKEILLELKELIFLLKQSNSLKSNIIERESIEQGVKK